MDDSYHLHRFLSDFRDLMSWIQDMKNIISADELAKDVAGAEALLEKHQEHKVRARMLCIVINRTIVLACFSLVFIIPG